MAVLGIDLGTTNTVVATVRGGRVQVLGDELGRRLLPSVVSFQPDGEVLVGHAAKDRRVIDAVNTVSSVKRLLGRSWRSPEIEQARSRFAGSITRTLAASGFAHERHSDPSKRRNRRRHGPCRCI